MTVISSILDSFEFSTSLSRRMSIIKTGNVYAIFYGFGPVVKTFSIGTDGIIGAEIDSETLDAVFGTDPSPVNVVGNIYAAAYEGVGADGWLSTISIDDNGNMGSVIASFEFDAAGSTNNSRIIPVSGNIYAIIYHDSNSDGNIRTVNISDDGTSISLVDTYIYNSGVVRGGNILHISGTTYALAYREGGVGYVTTITIENNGTIGAILNTEEFSPSMDYDLEFMLIYNDLYSLIYTEINATISTITISDAGVLTLVDKDTYASTAGRHQSFDIVGREGENTRIVISYADAVNNGNGYATTLLISDDGIIGTSESPLTLDTFFEWSSIVHLDGNISAVVYEAADGDGWIKTFSLSVYTIYPADAQTRVTSIIHRYDRGIYNMEIGLGEVVADFGFPNTATIAKKSYAKFVPPEKRKPSITGGGAPKPSTGKRKQRASEPEREVVPPYFKSGYTPPAQLSMTARAIEAEQNRPPPSRVEQVTKAATSYAGFLEKLIPFTPTGVFSKIKDTITGLFK